MTTLQAPLSPTISSHENLEHDFAALVDWWRRETIMLSSVHKMAMHPAYQRIIGMGKPALPLILRELQNSLDHWFWALNAITGEDPAKPDDNMAAAREAWLQWGKARGYLT